MYHEQILGGSHTGTKDRFETNGWHGPHLSSNNQEHLYVGNHDDYCCYQNNHNWKCGKYRSRLMLRKSCNGDPVEIHNVQTADVVFLTAVSNS